MKRLILGTAMMMALASCESPGDKGGRNNGPLSNNEQVQNEQDKQAAQETKRVVPIVIDTVTQKVITSLETVDLKQEIIKTLKGNKLILERLADTKTGIISNLSDLNKLANENLQVFENIFTELKIILIVANENIEEKRKDRKAKIENIKKRIRGRIRRKGRTAVELRILNILNEDDNKAIDDIMKIIESVEKNIRINKEIIVESKSKEEVFSLLRDQDYKEIQEISRMIQEINSLNFSREDAEDLLKFLRQRKQKAIEELETEKAALYSARKLTERISN